MKSPTPRKWHHQTAVFNINLTVPSSFPSSDPNTLFRGNSLASKLIDESMKVVGQSYLQRTLQSCIDEIFEAQKPCEIDTSRLTENDNVDINKVKIAHMQWSSIISLPPSLFLQANLLFFIEKILSAITASGRSCPQFMCRVFAMLRDAAVRRFPGKNHHCRVHDLYHIVLSLPPPVRPHCQTRLMLSATLQLVDLFSYGSLHRLFSIQNCSIFDMKTRSVVSIHHILWPCVYTHSPARKGVITIYYCICFDSESSSWKNINTDLQEHTEPGQHRSTKGTKCTLLVKNDKLEEIFLFSIYSSVPACNTRRLIWLSSTWSSPIISRRLKRFAPLHYHC